jgi:RND family efflux transporter MFP subunit
MQNPFKKTSLQTASTFYKEKRDSSYALITKSPWVSFFLLLIFLFALIFISHALRAPEVSSDEAPMAPRKVSLFNPQNDSLVLTLHAQVKKDSIVTINALVPGIVTRIYTAPGKSVKADQTLFALTNDYGSGASAIEREIAKTNASLEEEIYNLDKEIQSLDERRIKKDKTITGTQEDLAIARLEKDREIRSYNLASSRLNLSLALKNDSVLQPKSMLPGVVTNVAVRPGQFVTAGQRLATLTANGSSSTIEASLSPDTAWLIDPKKEAILVLPSGTVPLKLVHLSSQENESGLYTVIFSLPEETAKKLSDGFYTNIQVQLKNNKARTLLPLESVFQNNESAWVMIAENGFAKAQTVTLGNISGNLIEVTSGLEANTPVILSRGVIEGEAIVTE